MKKFVLLTIGFTQPTPKIMGPWMKWFKTIENKIVDQVGLRNGVEVTENDTKELLMDKNAITGYLIINAENIEEAIKIAQSGPMKTSTRIYEVATQQ